MKEEKKDLFFSFLFVKGKKKKKKTTARTFAAPVLVAWRFRQLRARRCAKERTVARRSKARVPGAGPSTGSPGEFDDASSGSSSTVNVEVTMPGARFC